MQIPNHLSQNKQENTFTLQTKTKEIIFANIKCMLPIQIKRDLQMLCKCLTLIASTNQK